MKAQSIILTLSMACAIVSCSTEEVAEPDRIQLVDPRDPAGPDAVNIDFSSWKVTLPVDKNNDNKPDEYMPSQLKDGKYRNLAALEDFMYDDDDNQGIIFHTYYGGSTTANSSFPRTELRELINPSNSRENWNLASGGVLKIRTQVIDVSNNTYTGSLDKDRFIMAQIHGIINPADVQRLGLSSDAAPPLLKMQWRDGEMYAYKKTLKDDNTTGDDLYSKSDDIWGDISFNFGTVGYDPFDIEIRASAARIDVTVNGVSHTFQDVSLDKWKFDSYFKAGVYLQSTDPAAFATVKIHSLEVTH
ncbi:polysaccharide lyase family 7 protein [Nonlabens agnitus]|uniref:Alginate lyase 2 domain-containing protein n=1 Tax=Nonlabens agnitus TaxID=870484 RepID=A0A2S9WT90_9FLAO|nr:polysaccharide lyase family 7 protein [Nonlabens agnitus]PRP66703.1 hypothetical protein BST86_06110 [Nonlabens agnitus]